MNLFTRKRTDISHRARFHSALIGGGPLVPLALLALLLLRMAAGLPGVPTPHSHGGTTHTHASGGWSHDHAAGRADDPPQAVSSHASNAPTEYPVRIAVRHRPSDSELFHAHTVEHEHAHGEWPLSPSHTELPPSVPAPAHDDDGEDRPGSYYCAAGAPVLADSSSYLHLPQFVPAGATIAYFAVERRASRRAPSPRGPPRDPYHANFHT